MPLHLRIQTFAMRSLARALGVLGLRERVFAAQQRRKRSRRAKLEAAGDARFSRPAAFEMDRQLDEIIDRDDGYFVEAGANDGYVQSNTYWLERFRGWTGLLVEPMEELVAEARANRPGSTVVRTALVPFDYPDATIRMTFGDLMTRVTQGDGDAEWAAGGLMAGWRDAYEADVPARPLSEVLDEVGAPEIDLLSLDVEGFEASVLRGLDLTRHAPRFVLVEMHDFAALRGEIEALLGPRYEEVRPLSPVDMLYRRVEAD